MEIRPAITVTDRKTGEKGRYRMDQEKILVGRAESSFIFLKDKTVSRRHAEIFREGDQFFLIDLKSGNNTFLNEMPLQPEEKMLLNSDDVIRIGNYDLRFKIPQKGDEDIYEKTDSDVLEVKMVKKLLKSLDRDKAPAFEIIEGPLAGKRFLMEGKSQEITIGRDPACEFRIDSDVISRKHARVSRKWDTVEIEDLGSRNGVYIGGERVRHRVLRDGDRIHLGTIILMFRNPQELEEDIFPAFKEEPPLPPQKKEERPIEKKPSSSQSSKKMEPDELPQEELEGPLSEPLPPKPRFSLGLSLSEIILGIVGLAVLIGAIWAIWKLL